MTVTQHHSNVTTRRENGDVKKPPSTLMSFIQTRLIKSIHANTSIEHTLFVIIQKIPLISRIQHTVRRKTHLTRKSTMRTIFAVKCQTLKMISNASRSQGKNQFNNVHMYCAYTKWNIFQRNCSYKPKYIDIYIYMYMIYVCRLTCKQKSNQFNFGALLLKYLLSHHISSECRFAATKLL